MGRPGRPINYQRYVEEYMKKSSKHKMFSAMLNEVEYRVTYKAYANELKAENKSASHIAEQIVSRQEYERSFKQGKRTQEVLKELGIEKDVILSSGKLSKRKKAYTIEEIRSNPDNISELLTERFENMSEKERVEYKRLIEEKLGYEIEELTESNWTNYIYGSK